MTDKQTFDLDLRGADVYDRIYGCWQGKNAGGTLGAPLETAWGQPDPFDIWWYPELQEGGIPNDDFEMQLVWLKALEEVGPTLTARDLSRYWLDHIGYNWDEYGLSKLNLKRGLEPPVSGNFNNWFIDCMGSPIRSEIWACVAPGAPRVAARYAYEDAICDHAGGEGVYGEVFNAALESAAFVVQDPQLLIDIALSYVPQTSKVRKAVETVVKAHADGLNWKEAREAVLTATPSEIAQYAPINTGFQIIGLLYGTDFGDGICKTVNCGYDTDSSGAAIGSYLGIIDGSKNLPEKWVAPLGNMIVTNEDWGGVKHLVDGVNPVPQTLEELVERIQAVSLRVLRDNGLLDLGATLTVALEDLYADDSVFMLYGNSPTAVPFPGNDIDVIVEYEDDPVAFPGEVTTVSTRLVNRRADMVVTIAQLIVPEGWEKPAEQIIDLKPGDPYEITWQILAPKAELVAPINRLYLQLTPQNCPVSPAIPVVLLGAVATRISGPYASDAVSLSDLLDTPFPPEEYAAAALGESDRPGMWHDFRVKGHAQPASAAFAELEEGAQAASYLQTYFYSEKPRDVYLVVDPSCPVKFWLNGAEAGRNDVYRSIRPNQKPSDGISTQTTLNRGWNELLVKIAHRQGEPTPELHVSVSGADPLNAYETDLDRSHFPWEIKKSN